MTDDDTAPPSTGPTPAEPDDVDGWTYLGAQGLGGHYPATWVDTTSTVGVTVAPTSRQVPLDSDDPDDIDRREGIYGTRTVGGTRTQHGFAVKIGLTDTWETIIQRQVRVLWADPDRTPREAWNELAAQAVTAGVMVCREHTPASARQLLMEDDRYGEYPANPYECPATFPPGAVDDDGGQEIEQLSLEEAVASK